jgi:hypothetical protein
MMIGVTGGGGATSAKDTDVLTLVTHTGESFETLGLREVSLGVFLDSIGAG